MNRIRSSAALVVVAWLGGVSVPSSLADIAYEGFDYATGQTVSGLNGGTGFNGAWSIINPGNGNAMITESLNGSMAEGNSLTVTPTSGTLYAYRPVNTISSGTVYYSFLIDNLSGGTRFMAGHLWSTGNELIYVGQRSGSSVWSINRTFTSGIAGETGSPSSVDSAVSTNLSEPVRLVLRIDFNAGTANSVSLGTNDLVRLYINPGASEPLTAAASVSTWDITGGFNRIGFGAGFTNASHTTSVNGVDEVRLATTWEALQIPEPSAGLALATGMMILASRRNRRRA